ncbi:MAG TPA: alpha/beta hydrolase, partial [Sediminibacterium sp.]|nr:alpha/beta hydrolase [Sediminibacterium sp.]
LFLIGVVFYKKDIPVENLKQLYANTSSQFIPLMGMNVHYRDEGNSTDSIPIVLIHGTSSSLLTWDSVVDNLKDKHRIIRMDLPAFGLTGPNPFKDYSFDYYTHFVDSFLLKLSVNKCIIIGNSLGGGIAWHYALAYPQKVAKLVLVDASGFSSLSKSKGALGFKIAQTPVLNQIVKFVTPRFLVRKSLEDVYADDSRISDSLVDIYFKMTLREGNRSALIDRMRAGFQNESEKIATLKTPTLIIWGEEDQLIPIEHAYRFQKAIPNSQLSVFKSVGHVPMEEAPKQFSTTLTNFLNQQ